MGYYLVDEGRTTLEQDVGYRRTWRDVVASLAVRAPLGCYLGGVAVVWLLDHGGGNMAHASGMDRRHVVRA